MDMVFILAFVTFVLAMVAVSLVRRYVQKREVLMAESNRGKVLYLVKEDAGSKGEVAVPWASRDELVLSPKAVRDCRMPIQFPKEVYYHRGHTWVKPEGGRRVQSVTVGLDDFTQEVMGDIEAINVPAIGEQLKQGEVAWEIHHGRRRLHQIAPLSGTVVDVNEKVLQDPSIVNRSPYEEGWILKIRPSRVGEEMPGLMDSFQFQVFFDQVKARLRAAIAHPSLGMIYGDGGEMVRGIAEKLDEKLWRIVVSQLFHAPK